MNQLVQAFLLVRTLLNSPRLELFHLQEEKVKLAPKGTTPQKTL
jgi:hypothetical protein